ncbi:MAG: OsmC family protein [Anaerolineae bacterium]|nr:OsmC family protein [Anaerolineae bacterium]MEB2286668.1 OsmC family protein [Anaerolineae bacterium]
MGSATVTWVQNLQFIGTDSTRHSVVVSAPDEANGIGMKPSELLLVSLAACTAYDVVNILQKKRKKLSHLRVEVEGEQQGAAPWPFTRIHLHYVIAGDDLSERDVAQAIHLSHDKYCSVSATLRPAVTLTHDYQIVGGADAGES